MSAPKDEWHTFKEWVRLGFRVKSGERSTRRNKFQEAVFVFSQVEEDPYHNQPSHHQQGA